MKRIAILSGLIVCAFYPGLAKAHVGTGIDLDRAGRIYFTDTLHSARAAHRSSSFHRNSQGDCVGFRS
jgi:hypothetical protein